MTATNMSATRRPMPAWLLYALAAAGVVLCICVAASLGPANISLAEVWSSIGSRLGLMESTASEIRDRIVWELRLPRALLAAEVGAGLAICGAILQSLTRNPLADPYLLGVSSGASLGAVMVIVLGFGTLTVALPLGAFLGALLAFGAVLVLAGRSTASSPGRIILAGVAATQLFAALSSFVIMWFADPNATRGVLFWLLGSLASARWPDVMICAVVLAAALVICLAYANALDSFAFGEDAAASLGISVGAVRIILYLTTAALTAVLVAFSGAIGFVGLVIPHMARMVVGQGHHNVLPVSAFAGAVFTILVDTIGRTAFAPREMAVGVITALIGVPVFAFIFRRRVMA